MLPLESKITPSDTGASSLEKDLISSFELPSKSWKLSFSRPVTSRFMGSVIVTGTSTKSTATFSGRTCVFRDAGTTLSFAISSVFAFSASPGAAARGWTWTSLTSVCPTTGEGKAQAAQSKIPRKGCERLLGIRAKIGLQGRTRWAFRTRYRNRVLGRSAISTSICRDSITAWLMRLRFFCQIFLTIRIDSPFRAIFPIR